MFASRNHKQAKYSGGRSPERDDSTPGRRPVSEENPLWQSLAMRSGALQPKLTIGQADDPYEREADRVADQVMRMPAPHSDGNGLSITPGAAHRAQRKCAGCEEEEEEGSLQRKESGGGEAPATAPPIVHETLRSPGQPLDTGAREFFEPRFGSDFSEVLVHKDGRAAGSAGAVNALAFTVDRHIVFGAGQYSPGTERGNRLLAHELAHVLQQNGRRNIANTGSIVRTQARPGALQMQGADVEDTDSDEFLRERPPNFTGVVVGSWGQLFPAELVGGERLDTSFPETEHSQAIAFATAMRKPSVIIREYHRLWIYELKWEGDSPFNNASTIQPLASSVSNVTGRPDVEAFVTEDGGVLAPLGSGEWFFHIDGGFEETAISFGQFTGVEVGSWGQSFPSQLIGGWRLDIGFPETEYSQAIALATEMRKPCVIMHEDDQLWIYELKWEGLSARPSRFTNASTIRALASPEEVDSGVYSASNVIGHPDVEAFVTEDGGVLLPLAAGKVFFHTGGEFEETAVSMAQNTVAFLGGMAKGLSDANFGALAERLQSMALLNAVFPLPFTVGAMHGVANALADFVKSLDPRQWQAMEAATRETILMLSDPDGEKLAALLGEEAGRAQAASLDQLLNKGPVTFAYEVGKIVGPTIVELLLALFGIEVGPLALFDKAGDMIRMLRKAPRLEPILDEFADVADLARLARPDGDTPRPPHAGVEEDLPAPAGHPDVPSPHAIGNLPELSPDEKALLRETGDRNRYPDKLPEDLAAKELAIAKRAKKIEIEGDGSGYKYEVDLGNGHKWKEKGDGTWCRFSPTPPTNCTKPETEVPKSEPIEPTHERKPDELAPEPEAPEESPAPASSEGTATQQPGTVEEILTEGQVDVAEPARPTETSPQALRAARQEEVDLLENRVDRKRNFDRINEEIEQLEDAIAEFESERDEILQKPSLTADDQKQLTRLSNSLERNKSSLEARQNDLASYQAEVDDIDNRLREIEVIKEQYRDAKPWRGEEGLSLNDPDVSRVGLYGELEVATAMQEAGFNPLGKTVRPGEINLSEDLEEAFNKYKGQSGIDGIFSRTDAVTGEQEYWIVESKATGAPDPKDPTGTAALDTETLSGHQMSNSWVLDRLDKAGLGGEDLAAIIDALTGPNGAGIKVRKVYAQTDAAGTRFFEIENVTHETVRIGNEITI
jgi:uncharacterized protein DUF4157